MIIVKEISLSKEQVGKIRNLNATLVTLKNILKEFRETDSEYSFNKLTEKLIKTQEEYDTWFVEVSPGVVTNPENSWNVDFDNSKLQLLA